MSDTLTSRDAYASKKVSFILTLIYHHHYIANVRLNALEFLILRKSILVGCALLPEGDRESGHGAAADKKLSEIENHYGKVKVDTMEIMEDGRDIGLKRL